MKRHRDIVITSSNQDAHFLARHIELFAKQSSDWEFLPEESSLYEQYVGRPSCCIITSTDSLPRAAIHFSKKANNSIYLTNIVPLAAIDLGIDQCNAIGENFSRSIQKYSRKNSVQIKIKMSKSEIKITDIVTGNISQSLLKRYLAIYPLSHHPSDIRRLDEFICSLARYSRKKFDVDSFQALLIEELNWSPKDAKWCRNRVEIGLEIGLEILDFNKNFRL